MLLLTTTIPSSAIQFFSSLRNKIPSLRSVDYDAIFPIAEQYISRAEITLSFAAAFPGIGTIAGITKVALGALQLGSALAFYLPLQALRKLWPDNLVVKDLTPHARLHVIHGRLNVVAGIVESIPLVGTILAIARLVKRALAVYPVDPQVPKAHLDTDLYTIREILSQIENVPEEEASPKMRQVKEALQNLQTWQQRDSFSAPETEYLQRQIELYQPCIEMLTPYTSALLTASSPTPAKTVSAPSEQQQFSDFKIDLERRLGRAQARLAELCHAHDEARRLEACYAHRPFYDNPLLQFIPYPSRIPEID